MEKHFKERTMEQGGLFSKSTLSTLQVNVTRKCNLVCKHCHLECGPNRTEVMERGVMESVIECFRHNEFSILDITGGAPEMCADLPFLLEQLRPHAKKIIVRTNLTILSEPDYQAFIDHYCRNKVELVASLPFYTKERTDRARGIGVYDRSIEVLKKLNERGYGFQGELKLHLVFNPSGAFLPADQEQLRGEYQRALGENYGIHFNELYNITNMPIGRFKNWLIRSENYEDYMQRLEDAYNPTLLPLLMCRDMVSVDYDGTLYDCDFHLATGYKIAYEKKNIHDYRSDSFPVREICTLDYCYGCTAGSGSS